jgi:hypothetical protein
VTPWRARTAVSERFLQDVETGLAATRTLRAVHNSGASLPCQATSNHWLAKAAGVLPHQESSGIRKMKPSALFEEAVEQRLANDLGDQLHAA